MVTEATATDEAKILANPDVANVCLALKTDFPDEFGELNVGEVKFLGRGSTNNIFEVGKTLFRFPFRDGSEAGYEVKALSLLKGKLPTAIPEITHQGVTCRYIGYEKIEGEILTDGIFGELSVVEHRQLVQDVATFQAKLHAIPVHEAEADGIEHLVPHSETRLAKWRELIPQVFEDEKVRTKLFRLLDSYKAIGNQPIKQVLLHGDITNENVLIDPQTKKLVGVIDFADTIIGDINIDFYPLTNEFGTEIIDAYEKQTGEKLSLERVEIYGRINDMRVIHNNRNPELCAVAKKRLIAWAQQQK